MLIWYCMKVLPNLKGKRAGITLPKHLKATRIIEQPLRNKITNEEVNQIWNSWAGAPCHLLNVAVPLQCFRLPVDFFFLYYWWFLCSATQQNFKCFHSDSSIKLSLIAFHHSADGNTVAGTTREKSRVLADGWVHVKYCSTSEEQTKSNHVKFSDLIHFAPEQDKYFYRHLPPGHVHTMILLVNTALRHLFLLFGISYSVVLYKLYKTWDLNPCGTVTYLLCVSMLLEGTDNRASRIFTTCLEL